MQRLFHAQDFAEYCAALTASATYNVYRKSTAPFMLPDQLMWRQRTRCGQAGSVAAPMRIANPGECPPSMRPPGTNDNVIERFDLMASRLKQSGGRIN